MTTQNLYALTDLWDAGGTTFTAIKMDVTDTASAAGSLLMDLQVGGSSKFKVTKAGVTLASDGVLATPAYSFSAETGSGLFRTATRNIVLGVNGTAVLGATDNGGNAVRLANAALEWTTNIGNGGDTILARDAANTLAQRNGTNAQAFRVYNTYTDASNYERGVFDWSSNANSLTIGAFAAGSGAWRDVRVGSLGGTASLYLTSVNTARWQVNSSGHFLAVTDNTYDIGASNATRPRNVHIAGYVSIGDGITAPGAGTGQARIYVDTADGDLKVVFADGTVKTIVVDT